MKPIWYFVGLILSIMGAILLINGIYLYFNPPERETILGNLHPSIWWGAIMVIAGVVFVIRNRKVVVR